MERGRVPRGRGAQRWGVPGVTFTITLLFVIVVLPSALNVPQSNPTQTLEFAPVPPENDEPPPPDAVNLESLSLGTSDGPGDALGNGPGVATPPPPPPGGLGERPVTKRCVGDPPRQTSDPMAPPCVAFFDGDNGGATYKGVTGDEIRLVVMMDGGFQRSNTRKSSPGSNEIAPTNRCYDLIAEPYDDEEHSFVTILRHWQDYFNGRYQTYKRVVRFIVCYAGESASPESRRADAAEYDQRFDPFATIVQFADWGYAYDYYDAMAGTGAMAFPRNPPGLEMFQRHQPRMWAYDTLIDREAENYASAVCQTVAPYPVSFSGNNDNGEPRKYGLIYTTDPRADALRDLKDLAVARMRKCGVRIAEEATHPSTGYFVDSQTTPEYALEAMARFQREGITTILWAGGNEVNFSSAAAQLNYRPEWVVASDGSNDGYYTARWQEKSVWQYAWNITSLELRGFHWRGTPCHHAFRSVKPDARDSGQGGGLEMTYACAYYEQLRQLFTAIQVAGPKLTPEAVDKGFRAIPPHPSSSPKVPACFYEPNDWTCVKDATAMWWDPAGVIEGEQGVGCWRMASGGTRYLAWQWPETNLANYQHTDTDPCSGEGRNLSAR